MPLLLVEIAISVIAPIATAVRIRPGLTMRSSAEPMKRPTIAPPQYRLTIQPTMFSGWPSTSSSIR